MGVFCTGLRLCPEVLHPWTEVQVGTVSVVIMAACTHGHFPKVRKPHWVECQETGVPQETLAWPDAGWRTGFPKWKIKKDIPSRGISGKNCSLNIPDVVFWGRPSPQGPHRAMVLNLWVTTPGGGWSSNNLFTGVTHQMPCISDIYIMIHNSKVTVMK